MSVPISKMNRALFINTLFSISSDTPLIREGEFFTSSSVNIHGSYSGVEYLNGLSLRRRLCVSLNVPSSSSSFRLSVAFSSSRGGDADGDSITWSSSAGRSGEAIARAS